jgi:hypothetical protein
MRKDFGKLMTGADDADAEKHALDAFLCPLDPENTGGRERGERGGGGAEKN